MSKEKTECSHIFQKNGDSCQFKHLHQIHLNVISWRILLTWRHCCPCRWGCRCTGSPPRQEGPMQCCTCSWSIVHYNHHQPEQEQSPFMFCIIAELPSVKSSETWLTVDDEARVESNNLVHWLMLLLRLLMFMLMLFRTMRDGVGLDHYYLASDDGTSEEKARGSSRDETWLDLSFSRFSLKIHSEWWSNMEYWYFVYLEECTNRLTSTVTLSIGSLSNGGDPKL